MRTFGLLATLLVVSCGTSDGDRPTDAALPRDAPDGTGEGTGQYKSGSRIKMQMLTTPDGAKIFQGNFDAQRNEPCNFLKASDGATRCLPVAGSPPIAAFSNLFTDNACTVPAAALACQTAPRYLYIFKTIGCESGYTIFPASPTPFTGALFIRSGTACQPATLLPGYTAFAASGPEVPPTGFQSATIGVE